MNLTDLKPSLFLDHPFESRLHKTEPEIIARNIMVIRKRLGDKWDISWQEYERERANDRGSAYGEKYYFDHVMKLIPDALGAISFSPVWADAARAEQAA